MVKLGVQLYSIKDEVQNDFYGSLKKLAEIGYKTVEFAGYNNIEAQTMKSWLEELGLEAISSHVPLEKLKANLNSEIQYLKVLGTKHIVCPYSPIKNREETLSFAKEMNKIGKICAEQGITFSYHNHSHEFVKDGGEYLLDILYSNTNSEYVKVQPDVYWIAVGGEDPVSYINKYKGRCPLVHLKELKNSDTEESTAVGMGILDFKAILAATNGSSYIIEQESVDMNVWEALKFGCEYINKLK